MCQTLFGSVEPLPASGLELAVVDEAPSSKERVL